MPTDSAARPAGDGAWSEPPAQTPAAGSSSLDLWQAGHATGGGDEGVGVADLAQLGEEEGQLALVLLDLRLEGGDLLG